MQQCLISTEVIVFWLVAQTCSEMGKDVALVGSSNENIILSLLDGHLLSVDVKTGALLWSLHEDPILTMPAEETARLNFFPNPKDGSLYFYSRMKDNLERLPLTIPELVQISPTKSTDGLLYTAMKSDVWLEIDPHSGTKLHTISSKSVITSYCPATEIDPGSVFISRTAYTISVYDSESKDKRWDITYLEYNSYSYSTDSYIDLYFSSTTDGIFVSIDPLTGDEKWRVSYSSPVVAVYVMEGQQLWKVPLYTVAANSIDLLKESSSLALRANTIGIKAIDTTVQTSLFVGFHHHVVYAVECFADERFLKMDFSSLDSTVLPLLDGPKSDSHHFSSNDMQFDDAIVGHYCLPETSQAKYKPASKYHKLNFKEVILKSRYNSEITTNDDLFPASDEDVTPFDLDVVIQLISVIISGSVAVLIAWIIIRRQVLSHSFSHSRQYYFIPGTDSEISIGKIFYYPQKMLGQGSHGTIVFKGTFDKRPIAVKRILPECYEMADHEVKLLRQSDEHPNVIRYYCMEEDSVFKYIALELCEITLHEYIENVDIYEMTTCLKTILNQAMKGLAHLHNLGIVHRDIKPRNVLLSHSADGGIRATISDFGLCRKLPDNRQSYTAISGIAGTEGWIAPEVFNQDRKVTYAADIFSMGCVIFFVLTKGSHPFGPSLKRQANISTGDCDLTELCGEEKYVADDLIKKMISNNCSLRPSSTEVLSHCFFWSENKKLTFFLDVSDRIEKEPALSRIVQSMESNASTVLGRDWRDLITDDLRTDLKRFRSYHGQSVRDLLRALRNKKHHYSELPQKLKESIGEIPNGFVFYFTSRFPRLLIHVYNRMEVFRNEPVLKQYYYLF